jgi:hypothetical protein
MSYYFHSTPGRLRIKSPVIRKNENACYEVRKLLGATSGIATIDINPAIGSLLINYNPKALKSADIINLLHNNGYYDKFKAVTQDQYIQDAASKAGEFIVKTVAGSVLGTALEGTPLSGLAVFI